MKLGVGLVRALLGEVVTAVDAFADHVLRPPAPDRERVERLLGASAPTWRAESPAAPEHQDRTLDALLTGVLGIVLEVDGRAGPVVLANGADVVCGTRAGQARRR